MSDTSMLENIAREIKRARDKMAFIDLRLLTEESVNDSNEEQHLNTDMYIDYGCEAVAFVRAVRAFEEEIKDG